MFLVTAHSEQLCSRTWFLRYLLDNTWLKLPSPAVFQYGNLYLEYRHHLTKETHEVAQMPVPLLWAELEELQTHKLLIDRQLCRSLHCSERRREERRGKASASNRTHGSRLPLLGVGVLRGAATPSRHTQHEDLRETQLHVTESDALGRDPT